MYDYVLTAGLIIDLNHKLVFRNGEILDLKKAEYCLLELLVMNSNCILLRSFLIEKLEDIHQHKILDNTLSVHMKRLRKTLGNENFIKTKHSLGYYWSFPVEKHLKIDTF